MKQILIVDDNDTYANNLIAHFEKLDYNCVRAYNAKDGWDKYLNSKNSNQPFETIVTDITMESQTSGLWFIRRVYKDGFAGIKIIATTGFDVTGIMFLSRFILPWFAGISFMIPKVPLKKGQVVLVPIKKEKIS